MPSDRYNGVTGSVYGTLAVDVDRHGWDQYIAALRAIDKTHTVRGRVLQVLSGQIQAATRALEDVAYEVLDESQDIVPYDTGALEASGKVQMERDSSGALARISYGEGPVELPGGGVLSNLPYAAAQHEHFYRHVNGRRRKYLQEPLMRARLAERVAEVVRVRREVLGSGRVIYRDVRGRFARRPQ